MKTKFYWVALLASAALIAQAKAGGNHGGGGGGGGGNFVGAAHPAPAFHSAPRNFGGGRFMGPGQRFSSVGLRSSNSFRQQRFGASDRAFARSHQVANGTTNRHVENRGSNTARDHVFARRTADWHRDWDRRHDHWWHGHRCHFANGSWFIYDIGFYPYDSWYPYDYYANGYYDYEDGADYYGQDAQDSSAQYADATVASAQQPLARQGYYRGEIDGIYGPETRRAIMRYQSNHGLRVTGNLTPDTLQALGLRRVANN